MHTPKLWLLAPLFAAGLSAQDPTQTPSAPHTPLTPAHRALEQWVGVWQGSGKMDAMPGVPGMEKPSTAKGTETGQLICGGLWLKWESAMTGIGSNSTGLWLVGYDPQKKRYIGYAMSSEPAHQGMVELIGKHDPKTKTWTWVGDTPMGKMKSVCEFSAPDRMKETLIAIDKEGKEKPFMVMTRVRGKDKVKGSLIQVTQKEALANPAAKKLSALLQGVGTWDGKVEMDIAGQIMKDTSKETVTAICGGMWTWSDYKGQHMGQPFVGHALTGWDPHRKCYTSLWIDSTAAGPTLTSGKYDAEKQLWTFSGKGPGPDGSAMQVEQRMTQKGRDTRQLEMRFEHPMGKMSMRIQYQRKKD